jgi:hypothetical protein
MLFGLNYHHEIEIETNTNVDIRFNGTLEVQNMDYNNENLRETIFLRINYMEIIPWLVS